MTDFIEWLRDFNREPPSREEAADRIEALSKENAYLREALSAARAALGETK